MNIFLAILFAVAIGAGYYSSQQSKKRKFLEAQKNKKAQEFKTERLKADTQRKEMAIFTQYPHVYKLVKHFDEDGTSFKIDVDEEYKNIFIEYLQRFKNFAYIKGYNVSVIVKECEDSNKIHCKFDLKNEGKKPLDVEVGDIFKNYLVNYPIFI